MSAQMDSLSSCLNPSLSYFAPTSLSSCKAAESHLGRVTCPQHSGDQHLLGNTPVTAPQAGQEHQPWQGRQVESLGGHGQHQVPRAAREVSEI